MKRTVLIVDDHLEFRSALADFLTDNGFVVWQAASAHEALERLRVPGQVPSFVLLDLGLPDLTGRALIDTIRTSVPRRVPVIVISGGAVDEVRDRFQVAAVSKSKLGVLLALLQDGQA